MPTARTASNPYEPATVIDPRYPSLAKRLKMNPEAAPGCFSRNSIDLLHLDASSDWIARRELVDAWLSRLSPRGVLLLHDIAIRSDPSYRSKLWEDLRLRYPVIHFAHGRGLGVVVVGSEIAPSLRSFLDAAEDKSGEIQHLFRTLGEAILLREEVCRRGSANRALRERLAQRGPALAELRREREESQVVLANLRHHAGRIETDLAEMMNSRSWRITAPLRIIVEAGRRVLRGLRRRTLSFPLEARNDLIAVDASEFNWRSIGPDPWFETCPSAGKHPIDWVCFSVALSTEKRVTPAPRIHFTDGESHEERNSVLLAAKRDGRFAAIAHVHQATVHFRFVPSKDRGLLHVGALRCQEISAIEGVCRLCWPYVKPALRSPRRLFAQVIRALRLLRHGGFDAIWSELRPKASCSYEAWVEAFDTLGDEDRRQIKPRLEALKRRPSFSVVMPVYNPEIAWLRRAIDSVLEQWYPDWELCIADDASENPQVRRTLEEYAILDHRIRVTFRKERGHISAASNTALEMAQGDFVALLDHDDELRPHALLLAAEEISENPGAEIIYSDEDKLDRNGSRYDPYFKPDWDPDLFYSQNFVNHLGVYRRSRVNEIGGFREGYEGAQDYDLVLRLLCHVREEQIRHIAHVLYHWRAAAGSTALDPTEKEYAHEAGRRALRDYFRTKQCNVKVEAACEGSPHHRVVRLLPPQQPFVSVIIPTRDRPELLQKAVKSCLEGSDYPELELLIVDNESKERDTLELFDALQCEPRVRVLSYPGSFNYSAINNFAIEQSKGQLILLLNNDVEAISPGWLREMVSHAVRPEIGAVGAMLYYPNDEIQHAGVVVGVQGVASHAYRHFPRGSVGCGGRARVVQSLSAVTGACLMTRREVLDEVGKLDDKDLRVAFNDIDLCLRIRERGYRILWTPYAELYHLESASRGDDESAAKRRRFQREIEVMKERWEAQFAKDPYYNPNLTATRADFSLAFPPRVTRGRLV